MKKEIVQKIIEKLKKNYPDSKCSLEFQDPAQLLVATMLSAQCTDKQVNKVTPILFETFPSVKALADADLEEIKAIIRPTGFYNNKAKAIKKSMKSLQDKYQGEVPDNLDDLVKLDGVGRKTANVVLGDAFGIPGIVVDTHVKRIANRLGMTRNENPDKIEQDLMKLLPPEKWTLFGHMIIDHGRAICKARKPECEKCFLQEECRFYKKSRM
ncbi:MAG: endonuclease III [Candidatus Marinimicrobia bacterium]|nr:endonuclease III [Candidatus Neomarinimicrobiota bacterium]